MACKMQLCGAYCGAGHFAQAPLCEAYDMPGMCGPSVAPDSGGAGGASGGAGGARGSAGGGGATDVSGGGGGAAGGWWVPAVMCSTPARRRQQAQKQRWLRGGGARRAAQPRCVVGLLGRGAPFRARPAPARMNARTPARARGGRRATAQVAACFTLACMLARASHAHAGPVEQFVQIALHPRQRRRARAALHERRRRRVLTRTTAARAGS